MIPVAVAVYILRNLSQTVFAAATLPPTELRDLFTYSGLQQNKQGEFSSLAWFSKYVCRKFCTLKNDKIS